MKKIFSTILIILTLGIILIPRFFQLGSTPPGLHIDEVSFAADAKAIAETLRDTHNVFLPRVFQAFGEYKAPGLTYTMAFWSKVLGRMDNSVARLPSAIAGVVTIIMLVLTIQVIYPSVSVPILASIAIILAYSPWHFDLSRIFYESFSALGWISISLFLATRELLKPKTVKSYEWYLLVATAAISGYYYASFRYVIIGYLLIFSFLHGNSYKQIAILFFKAMLVMSIVGIFWVADLFSNVGLNRLHYYQQKANTGATLSIDEKRQFCYLALNRNDKTVKGCYFLWNKPVEKITGGIKTIATYLGTDYLFFQGESEYGFDKEFGAYLFPTIIFYVTGLYYLLTHFLEYLRQFFSKKRSFTPLTKLSSLYLSLALLSLVPSALALNINMRMATFALYIVAIAISIGLIEFVNWSRHYLPKLIYYIVLICLSGSFIFYAFQSVVHYFFVFTKSNDLQWTSDAGKIFKYVKSVSSNYDHIIDTELHGPLAPYFYGDVTTAEVQNGTYNNPDDIGFFYLIKAGKYELRHVNIHDLACETLSKGDTRRTLVISNPYPDLISVRKYAAMSSNNALLLHEVYDLSDVTAHDALADPNYFKRCSPK